MDEETCADWFGLMLAEHVDEIALMWRWGDGDGGALLNQMREAVRSKYPACVPSPLLQPRPGKRQISQRVRWRIFRRDGYRCLRCGAEEDLTLDHIVAESNGGTDDETNLQTLCRSCNSAKAAS